METININNYEAYFLDFLEGNLSVADENALMVFLENYPDLFIEFNELLSSEGHEHLILNPSLTVLDSKEDLKVDEDKLSLLTVDLWMIESIEGQLSKEDEVELGEFVKENDLQKKFKYFQSTILVPTSEVYGDKADLKRKKAVVIPMFYKVASIAAVIIVLVGLFFMPSNGNQNSAAVNDTVDQTVLKEIIHSKGVYAQNPKIKVSNTSSDEQINKMNNNSSQDNLWVEFKKEKNIPSDTIKELVPITPLDDQIVRFELKDSLQNTNQKPNIVVEDDPIAFVETKTQNQIKYEEPYKLITNLAGNLLKRDVSFKRTQKQESNDDMAFQFKLGKFEFERKKSK